MSATNGSNEDSDNEQVPEFYYPRRQNARANAVKRLRLQRENEFINDMLGSLTSVIQYQDEKDSKNEIEVPAEPAFDPMQLTSQCIKSWRRERKLISSSVSDYMKRQRGSLRNQESSQLRSSKSKSVEKKDAINGTKYRKEPEARKLNEFLNSLHSQIIEAEEGLQKFPRKKFQMKDEDILSRPTQLVKLEKVDDAGTGTDELRVARKNTLEKLSKKCAYSMVHINTPLEHRSDAERELHQVHGNYTEEEIFDSLVDKYKESQSKLNLTRLSRDPSFVVPDEEEGEYRDASDYDTLSLDSPSRI